MGSFTSNVDFAQPVGAGEVLEAGHSQVTIVGYDKFEDGLVVGQVCVDIAGVASKVVDASVSADFLGVALRKLGSTFDGAYHNDLTNFTGANIFDPIADVCKAGQCTVAMVTGEVPARGDQVYVVTDGSANTGLVTKTQTAEADQATFAQAEFVRLIKDGVALINIKTQIS